MRRRRVVGTTLSPPTRRQCGNAKVGDPATVGLWMALWWSQRALENTGPVDEVRWDLLQPQRCVLRPWKGRAPQAPAVTPAGRTHKSQKHDIVFVGPCLMAAPYGPPELQRPALYRCCKAVRLMMALPIYTAVLTWSAGWVVWRSWGPQNFCGPGRPLATSAKHHPAVSGGLLPRVLLPSQAPPLRGACTGGRKCQSETACLNPP